MEPVVELAFVKGDVAARRDDGVGRDAVFRGLVVVVGEEPAADGRRAGGGIVKLDGVALRRVGMGEGLVDDHGREDRRRGASARPGEPLRAVLGRQLAGLVQVLKEAYSLRMTSEKPSPSVVGYHESS